MKVIPKGTTDVIPALSKSDVVVGSDRAAHIGFVEQYLVKRLAQHPDSLLVIVAGMGQSGSTLLYNMIKALAVSSQEYDCVAHGPIFELAYLNHPDSSLKSKTKGDKISYTVRKGGFFDLGSPTGPPAKCFLVVKTHGYYPILYHLASTVPNCKILTPRRDLRDTVASLCRKKILQNPHESYNPITIAQEQLSNYNMWKSISDYEFVYEDYILGSNERKHQIMRSMYESIIGNSDELFSDTMDDILALVGALPEFALSEEIEKATDSPSLMTKYNVTNQGKVGGYKEHIFKDITTVLEKDILFSHWLREYGYL
jgi:hypothetical protein